MANPDPKTDHLTPWKPGQSGNPGGMTADQVEKRRQNRDRAFAIEERLLAALEKDMTENEAAILDHVRADVLRLIHTAIERVDGKPKQSVDLESPEGTLSAPTTVQIVPVAPEGSRE